MALSSIIVALRTQRLQVPERMWYDASTFIYCPAVRFTYDFGKLMRYVYSLYSICTIESRDTKRVT